MTAGNAAERFVEIRNRTGMNRKDFAEWLDIPYRTMQEWELGRRVMPEYLLKLVDYKVQNEFDSNNLGQHSVSAASFGLRLKEARIGCGMRQEDAAEIMGMKRPTLSAIEADKRQVTAEEIVRFSDLYKVSALQLLYDKLPEQIHDKESVLGNLQKKKQELDKTTPKRNDKQKEASRHSSAPKIGPVTPCNCKHPCPYGNGRSYCWPCYKNIMAEHREKRAATGNA